MRGVGGEQPLHPLLDIQYIGSADDEMSARLQHARELTNRLLRVLDMFETFHARDVVELAIAVRQRSAQIPTPNLHAAKPENLRIQIAAMDVKSRRHKPRGQRPFAGRHIEQSSPRQRLKYRKHRLVRSRPRQNSRRQRRRPLLRRPAHKCGLTNVPSPRRTISRFSSYKGLSINGGAAWTIPCGGSNRWRGR